MTLGMRDEIAKRTRSLLTDMSDNELTLLPMSIRDEVDNRVSRARQEVERAQRELERRSTALEEALKRFEVKEPQP